MWEGDKITLGHSNGQKTVWLEIIFGSGKKRLKNTRKYLRHEHTTQFVLLELGELTEQTKEV